MQTNVGPSGRRELISFQTGGQEFCLDINDVREIRCWTPATPMPEAPEFVQGVINLRGTVMPVLDLGARFGFGPTEPTARHAIIVAEVDGKPLGLLVEAVCETLQASAEDIQPAPDLGGEPLGRVVQGFLPMGERMVTLVDLGRIAVGGVQVEAALGDCSIGAASPGP